MLLTVTVAAFVAEPMTSSKQAPCAARTGCAHWPCRSACASRIAATRCRPAIANVVEGVFKLLAENTRAIAPIFFPPVPGRARQ